MARVVPEDPHGGLAEEAAVVTASLDLEDPAEPDAAALIARSRPPSSSLHDWWSYLVVSAHGGSLVADPTPTVMYRQHPANIVGAPLSMRRRAVAAWRRKSSSTSFNPCARMLVS